MVVHSPLDATFAHLGQHRGLLPYTITIFLSGLVESTCIYHKAFTQCRLDAQAEQSTMGSAEVNYSGYAKAWEVMKPELIESNLVLMIYLSRVLFENFDLDYAP